MTSMFIFSLAAVAIFALAVYSTIVARQLLRKLIAINVMGSATFLVLIAAAARPPGEPDPIPHAMVLTGIVVTVAATGLAVTLIRQMAAETGRSQLPEDERLDPEQADAERPAHHRSERGQEED